MMAVNCLHENWFTPLSQQTLTWTYYEASVSERKQYKMKKSRDWENLGYVKKT